MIISSNSLDKEKAIIRRNDAQYVFSYITREINFLSDGDKLVKKEAISNLHNFICNEKPSLRPEFIQEILISYNKNFIKIGLFDSIDKCRETALKILIK
jgi:hypothetical protein